MIPKSLEKRAELFPQLNNSRKRDTTRVVSPTSYRLSRTPTAYRVPTHTNKQVPNDSVVYGFPRRYDELRNEAIAGNADAIKNFNQHCIELLTALHVNYKFKFNKEEFKMRMNWEDVKETKALVTETLSNTELVKLFYDLRDIEHGYPALPEGTYGGSVIDNVIYESWDGERHYGCLVTIMMPYGFGKNDENCFNDENYFMERTWTLIGETAKTYVATPTYHRLFPVTIKRNNPKVHGEPGSMEYLVSNIIHTAYQENIIFEDKITFLNSFSEANANRSFDKSSEEIANYETKCRALLYEFVTDKIPAGDSKWDDLLFGDRGFRAEVFTQLRKKGHNVHLDGEKDSFGWVTCGIVMDGNLMTSEYF